MNGHTVVANTAQREIPLETTVVKLQRVLRDFPIARRAFINKVRILKTQGIENKYYRIIPIVDNKYYGGADIEVIEVSEIERNQEDVHYGTHILVMCANYACKLEELIEKSRVRNNNEYLVPLIEKYIDEMVIRMSKKDIQSFIAILNNYNSQTRETGNNLAIHIKGPMDKLEYYDLKEVPKGEGLEIRQLAEDIILSYYKRELLEIALDGEENHSFITDEEFFEGINTIPITRRQKCVIRMIVHLINNEDGDARVLLFEKPKVVGKPSPEFGAILVSREFADILMLKIPDHLEIIDYGAEEILDKLLVIRDETNSIENKPLGWI